MMFDWDDPDQVGETIWGEFKESEDHIVPYPNDTEQHPVFTFEECNKKQRNGDVSTIPQSTGQSSGARNEFPGCRLVNSSSLNANEDHSGSRLEVDTWLNSPSLNAELSTGYNNGNNQDSLETSKMLVQQDGESESFGGECKDKENDSFLDCDWANIGDFDDLDRIFSSESIFGHDMVTNVDEFLSSANMIGSTMQSIPMPDITLTRDQHSDQSCSSSQLVEHYGAKRKVEDKTADTAETGEQAVPQASHSSQLTEEGDRKKKLLKSRKKAEERSKIMSSQIFNVPWPQNIGLTQQFPGQNVQPLVLTPSQTIPSPVQAQQKKVSDTTKLMENIGLPSQFIYSQYVYPAYPFPGIPVLQHVQADSHRRNDVPIDNYPDPLKYANNSNMVPATQSKPLAMTPQEKIEKLRRRQQAQAMLAIQKQQQQFGHQITGAEDMVCQENYQTTNGQEAVKSDIGVEENGNKLPASDINLLLLEDSSQRISTLTDDNCSEKTIYQLRDALRKLDIRVRLSIRDSLFRLARSSMERQNASDSSTNKSTRDEDEASVHEEANIGKRQTLRDAEAYTNPIDRTVAQLLFHRPLESCTIPMNDALLQ